MVLISEETANKFIKNARKAGYKKGLNKRNEINTKKAFRILELGFYVISLYTGVLCGLLIMMAMLEQITKHLTSTAQSVGIWAILIFPIAFIAHRTFKKKREQHE